MPATYVSYSSRNYTGKRKIDVAADSGKNHWVTTAITGIAPGRYGIVGIGILILNDVYSEEFIIGPTHHVTLNIGDNNVLFEEDAAGHMNQNWQVISKFKRGSTYTWQGHIVVDLPGTTIVECRCGLRDTAFPINAGTGFNDKIVLMMEANLHVVSASIEI
jgi:hypothetical protein